MKKHSIIISALLISILGFSQGIKFEQGTWKEVLEKARQINKPIFLNVYKPWSVPCKRMNNEVFPLAEVGNVYNVNFSCYQLDAEKVEGIEIAKKYNIEMYPTYLFINENEKSFFHVAGAKETKEFIELSKSAFFAMNDTIPITAWEKGYHEKKNDTNDASVSLILTYGDETFLLTGDLPGTEETKLLQSSLPKNVTVYKAGHHGSKYSSSEPLLSYIHPEYAVISAGKDNKYGHPNPEALERLKKYSKEIISTIDRGTISFMADGRMMEVVTER